MNVHCTRFTMRARVYKYSIIYYYMRVTFKLPNQQQQPSNSKWPGCRSFCSLRCHQQTTRHKSFLAHLIRHFSSSVCVAHSRRSTGRASYAHTPDTHMRPVNAVTIFSEYTFIIRIFCKNSSRRQCFQSATQKTSNRRTAFMAIK